MERAQVLIRNISYNFLSYFWFAILALVTTPYIVKNLGTDAYGILAMVSIIVGYFALLDLGFGGATLKYVSEYYAKKEYGEVGRIMGTSLAVYLSASLLGTLLIALLARPVITHFLHIPPQLLKDTYFVFYLTALSFLFSMLFGLYGSIPQALQRFDLFNKLNIAIQTFSILGTVLLLYLGFFLREIVILYALLAVVKMSIFIFMTRRLLPGVSLKPALNLGTFSKMFRFGGLMTVGNISLQASDRVDRLLIGFFLPIANLTYYAIPFNLASQMKTLVINVTRAIFPALSELSGKNIKNEMKELYLRATKFSITILLPVLFLSLTLGRKFLLFWMGADFALKSTLPLQLLASSFLITSSASVAITTTQAVAKVGLWTRLAVSITILNILLCLLLIPKFGIRGAALSLLIYSLLCFPFFVHKVNYQIVGISDRELISKSCLRPLLLGVIFFFCLLLLRPLVRNLALVFVVGGIASLLYFLAGYFFIFDNRERRSLLTYLREIKR